MESLPPALAAMPGTCRCPVPGRSASQVPSGKTVSRPLLLTRPGACAASPEDGGRRVARIGPAHTNCTVWPSSHKHLLGLAVPGCGRGGEVVGRSTSGKSLNSLPWTNSGVAHVGCCRLKLRPPAAQTYPQEPASRRPAGWSPG